MKEDLLDASRDFKTNFLDKYPDVQNPSGLLSTFSRVLNDSKPELPDCSQAINSVSVLLSNSSLEQFAEAGSAGSDAADSIGDADQVVYGDGENLAGLNELVAALIECLG